MPAPRQGETRQDYVSRFMASAEAKRDYPDEKQRAAVAYSMWGEKGNSEFPCKCGHSKAAHDKQRKGGWCTGVLEDIPGWKGGSGACDCDGYEADQYKFLEKNSADSPMTADEKGNASENQGKVVCEEDNEGWMVMTPDGEVTHAKTRAIAERYAKSWFARNLKSEVGVGKIEWRLLPENAGAVETPADRQDLGNRRYGSVQNADVKVACKRCGESFSVGDWDETMIKRKTCPACIRWEDRFTQRDSQETREGWSNPI